MTETWLTENVYLSAFNDNSGYSKYTVFRHDRHCCTGGGVLLAVKNIYPCKLLSSYSFDRCECLFADIEIEKGVHLKTAVVYRPPNASLESSNLLFNCLLNELELCKRYLVTGDFNMPDIDWTNFTANSQVSIEFLTTFFKLGASQCVTFPTRNSNLLDLVLCSDSQMIDYIHADPPVSTSDHDSIVLGIKCRSCVSSGVRSPVKF